MTICERKTKFFASLKMTNFSFHLKKYRRKKIRNGLIRLSMWHDVISIMDKPADFVPIWDNDERTLENIREKTWKNNPQTFGYLR